MAKPPLSSFLISAIAEPQKRQQTVHYLLVERSFGSVKKYIYLQCLFFFNCANNFAFIASDFLLEMRFIS